MNLQYEDFKLLIDQFIKEVIDHLGDKILGVALFGSVARGSATQNSDIDSI